MSRPSASSPMATQTPPAPKSLQRLISRETSRVAEQALDLALGRRVALLHLRAADLHGFCRCALWRSPVAPPMPSRPGARRPAERPRRRPRERSAQRLLFGRSADHGADLHALCHIAGVIKLRDLAGGQADLVAVGAVALRRAGGNFAAGAACPPASSQRATRGSPEPVTRMAWYT